MIYHSLCCQEKVDCMDMLVLDACCLINLCASQRLNEIASTLSSIVLIHEFVANESLYIRQPADNDPTALIPVQIDIAGLTAGKSFRLCQFSNDSELQMFVDLASVIDDGEAASIAVAHCRKLTLATDDRKAIFVARSLDIPVLTTPELLLKWINATNPNPVEVSTVINNIEQYAKFRPHPLSAFANWWESNHF